MVFDVSAPRLEKKGAFLDQIRIRERAELEGRTFATRFLTLRRPCTPSEKRGGSRLGANKLGGKWPHNAHPRAGVGGRRLRRKRKKRLKIDWFWGTGVGNRNDITLASHPTNNLVALFGPYITYTRKQGDEVILS